ncbi:MAG: hypothetical protein QM674_01690 [Burkholderiaceae bacterium]
MLIEQPDGSVAKHARQFSGFERDCRALAVWLSEPRVQLVIMESTGIDWKSVYLRLESADAQARVVNAHFIEHVPDRKPICSIRDGWRCWPASAWCAAASSRRRICASRAWSRVTGASSAP